MIVRVDDYTDMKVLGRTRDDAAGEAIDKIARVVGLGYPGGPKMDKAGQGGDTTKYVFSKTHMGDTLDFSFSGLKTSALNLINGLRQKGEEIDLKDSDLTKNIPGNKYQKIFESGVAYFL